MPEFTKGDGNVPPPLTGPYVAPASGKPPACLVLLLHGYGADGEDLIGLSTALAPSLPDAAFAAPNAPFPCEAAPFGRQWFPLMGGDDASRLAGARRVAPRLGAYVDETLARIGLDSDRLVILGFSQGCMLGVHFGLRRSPAPLAILGFSGRVLDGAVLGDEIVSRPPVLLVHGSGDDVVPMECLQAGAEVLNEHDVPVATHLVPNLGHGIDENGLGRAVAFLRDLGLAD